MRLYCRIIFAHFTQFCNMIETDTRDRVHSTHLKWPCAINMLAFHAICTPVVYESFAARNPKTQFCVVKYCCFITYTQTAFRSCFANFPHLFLFKDHAQTKNRTFQKLWFYAWKSIFTCKRTPIYLSHVIITFMLKNLQHHSFNEFSLP